MWCIGSLTEQYRSRMYKLLALYAKPLRCDEPVICIDEKSFATACPQSGAAADRAGCTSQAGL